MCGIAGVMMSGVGPVPETILDVLSNSLSHRGPDDRGIYIHNNVGLVHTRLSIVDVDGGHQPLSSSSGVTLVANGEIYNDPEIRGRLSSTTFKSKSDSESALKLYESEGESFAEKLRGMYALAIHDPAENKLVLARDPFGIKPLYFAETEFGFCFASEPQALIAAGLVKAQIHTAVRDEFLSLQFSTGAASVFKNIHRVRPGETVVVKGGRIQSRLSHVDVCLEERISRSDHDAVNTFDEVWREAVLFHQRSDVPYGIFLSGGLDSTAVLAMMARLNTSPILAYTAAFPNTKAADERDYAQRAAAAVGATHVEVEVSANDFWNELPSIAAAIDDPVPDYAVVPTYCLARRAAQDVKVVLTGEGGDEMFGGYGRYRAALRPWPFSKGPYRRHILEKAGVLRAFPRNWRKGLSEIEQSVKQSATTPLNELQKVDCLTWLPNDLLIKLDRCLMAHGVEGRVPFLDSKISKFAFSLEDNKKMRNGFGKWILRQWLSKHFPRSAAFAPKRGFTVPVAEWIAEEGPRLGPLVAQQEGVAELCKSDRVESLYRNVNSRNGHAAWMLLFYALWHRRHMLGVQPVGDAFETLSRPH